MSDLVVMPAEQLAAIVKAELSNLLTAMPSSTECAAPAAEGGIVPTRVYTAEEAADALGLNRKQTMFEIPEAELPRRRIGPRRGATRFLGRDLLRYVLGLPPVDDGTGLGMSACDGTSDTPSSAQAPILDSTRVQRPATPPRRGSRRKRLI